MKPAGVWIRVFRLRGIGVYVEPLVIAVLALVFLGGKETAELGARLAVLGIVLGSVFLHELAHAFMARRRGLAVSGIYLHLVPFAYVERGRPADELRVALAGPAVNLLVAGVLLLLPGVAGEFPWRDLGAWLERPAWTALGVNLLMGVLNLVPALPADGGRALRAFLLQRMPPASAYARTARVGTFVGTGLLVLAIAWRRWPEAAALAVMGAFLIMVAWREARAGQRERRMDRERARQ
jgi:Zn-dependent protease